MGKILSKKDKSKDNAEQETNEVLHSAKVPVTPQNQSPYANDVVIQRNDVVIQSRAPMPVPIAQSHYSNDPIPIGSYQHPSQTHSPNMSRGGYPTPNQNPSQNISRSPYPYPSEASTQNIVHGDMDIYCETPEEDTNVRNEDLYVALYDYEKRSESEMSISEGDQLQILDKSDDNWWLAIIISTQEQGYVPQNYIAESNSLDSQPWYFGNLKRTEANRNLKLPENEIGAFLVRDSLSDNQTNQSTPYSLSVRFGENIRNYRIGKKGNLWYITNISKIQKNSVQELIDYFKQNDGLCCYLGKPCFNPEQPITAGLAHGDKWELDKSAVQLNKEIGSGQFGKVYDGIASNTRVAIKTLKPGTMPPEKFLAEALLMKQLLHKNLIKLYAVCTKDEPIYIITEFMGNGDLLGYLRKGGKHLTEDKLIDMSSQIAAGMSYLEENSYIHRDLAARNVLVGENNIVKVADFGLSRLIEDDEYSPQAGAKFPVKWTAPEAITHCTFTIKSDVWSFGIVLFEIISKGKMPYPGMANREVMTMVESGYRMPKSKDCPDNYYQIMLKCWNSQPQERPTFQALTWEFDEYYNNLPDYHKEQDISQMEQNRRFR